MCAPYPEPWQSHPVRQNCRAHITARGPHSASHTQPSHRYLRYWGHTHTPLHHTPPQPHNHTHTTLPHHPTPPTLANMRKWNAHPFHTPSHHNRITITKCHVDEHTPSEHYIKNTYITHATRPGLVLSHVQPPNHVTHGPKSQHTPTLSTTAHHKPHTSSTHRWGLCGH